MCLNNLFTQSRAIFLPDTTSNGILSTCNLNSVKVRSYYNDMTAKIYENRAKYGGRFMVTVMPGDGIGPEMISHVRKMFK